MTESFKKIGWIRMKRILVVKVLSCHNQIQMVFRQTHQTNMFPNKTTKAIPIWDEKCIVLQKSNFPTHFYLIMMKDFLSYKKEWKKNTIFMDICK
jgi:hypothetical protein